MSALALASLAPVIGAPSGAVHAGRTGFVNIWVPYWDASAGSSSYGTTAKAQLYGEISPFFLQAQGDGAVVGVGSPSRFAESVRLARAQNLRVVPTITDGTGKLGMQRIIGDDTLRANHIANIVTAIVGGGYDGIDLDYEVFAFTDGSSTWVTTMPLWVQFVHQLGDAMHASGKALYVTIPPQWTTPGKDYWVYAQDQIHPYIDRLRLMVYDWNPGTPSATAPITWVQQVVNYSTDVAGVPVSKLELGVPAYGRQWRRSVNGDPCPDGALVTNSVKEIDAPALAAGHGVVPQRDTASGEMTYSWDETVTGVHTNSQVPVPVWLPPDQGAPSVRIADGSGVAGAVRLGPPPTIVTCTVRHTVFYPDGWSIKQKARVALDRGWTGIAMWAASYESNEVYDILATVP